MKVRATRSGGGVLVVAGAVFIGYFLTRTPATVGPVYWLFQTYPIALALAVIAMGVLLACGRLVADRFVPRLFGWLLVGLVVIASLPVWFFGLAVGFGGRAPMDPPVALLTIPPLGALVGLLVGTYDVRAIERQEAVDQLRRINETLRLATSDLVTTADRDALERAVCQRVVEYESIDAAWIGRVDDAGGPLHIDAWAGFDDADESLALASADQARDTVWERVIETGEGLLLEGDLAAESLGPVSDSFERHGVAAGVAVPIAAGDRVHGLLCLCADDASAFDEQYREVFLELGETVGHAIASIQAHEALETRERELLTQNERLDEFAGVVSHDLRNPLNVILSRTALLQRDGPSDGLAEIERSGHRMAEIISDLLALSRASRAAVDLEPVALAGVADESWRTVETDAAAFELEIPDGATALADPARLRTLFENLFRNAVEHGSTSPRSQTREDAVEHGSTSPRSQAHGDAVDHGDHPLTVRVGLLEPASADGESPGGFFVEDDGPGIPADERDAVFDHGFTTNAGGTGFGLSIVSGVADAHDWTVAIADVRADGAGDGRSSSPGVRFEVSGVEFLHE